MRRKRCQRIEESNRTFLDLTTDSNCHRPTTSLDTVSGNLVLRAPLPLLLSTVALPSYSLLFSLSLSLSFQSARVFVYPCTHIPSAQHRHPRVTTLLLERENTVQKCRDKYTFQTFATTRHSQRHSNTLSCSIVLTFVYNVFPHRYTTNMASVYTL